MKPLPRPASLCLSFATVVALAAFPAGAGAKKKVQPPTISVTNATVAEKDSDTTVKVRVSLSKSTSKNVTVKYKTLPGTASKADYLTKSGILTIPAGKRFKTITLVIKGDTLDEKKETFKLQLSQPTGAKLLRATGTIAIVDDESADASAAALVAARTAAVPPTIAMTSAQAAEGTGSDGQLLFAVTLSKIYSGTVTVDYATSAGTATPGSDYTEAIGTLTFAPGETSKVIAVTVKADPTLELDESLTVTLSNATGGATFTAPSGIGTIANDDAVPTASLSADVATTEGNSHFKTYSYTVTLSNPADTTISVDISVTPGTATMLGFDYSATNQTLTFLAGETSKSFIVAVNGDTTYEPDETFTVVLANPQGATIGDGSALGTIFNDDGLPTISTSNVQSNEGTASNGQLTFTVLLSAASVNTITVDYATAAGTATASGDFTSTSGSLTFLPGQTSKQVTVTLVGDNVYESNETMTLNLSNASGATFTTASATGTITNDDSVPSLTVGNASITEGNSGTKLLTFTLQLSNASSSSASTDVATQNGTATTTNSDYVATSSTVTFTAGQTSKTVSVTINGDLSYESDETFWLDASNPQGMTIADANGLGTILNDDDPIPSAPTTLTATATSSSSVSLTWNTSTYATSYKVYRSTTSGSGYALVGSPATNSYTNNSGLASNMTYYYVVTAVNTSGDSGYSNEDAASTDSCNGDTTANSVSPTDLGTRSGDSTGTSSVTNSSLCRQDKDYYKITISENVSTTSALTALVTLQPGANTRVEQMNSDMRLCIYYKVLDSTADYCSNNVGNTALETASIGTRDADFWPVTADETFDMYILVEPTNTTNNGTYTLTVTGDYDGCSPNAGAVTPCNVNINNY